MCVLNTFVVILLCLNCLSNAMHMHTNDDNINLLLEMMVIDIDGDECGLLSDRLYFIGIDISDVSRVVLVMYYLQIMVN